MYTKLDEVREGPAPEHASGKREEVAGPRVILATRRLPFDLHRKDDGSGWRAVNSIHLFRDQALDNYRRLKETQNCLWVGWAGQVVEQGEQAALREQLMSGHGLVSLYFLLMVDHQHFFKDRFMTGTYRSSWMQSGNVFFIPVSVKVVSCVC